ncbi:MAG: Molybdopterin oxidoreductase subunitprotein [Myxococcaceae bacterium]|nr:Molybdopterin oxidoreductase subunitprotein [Myxococcaceae bacterium]
MAQIFPRWSNETPRYTLIATLVLASAGIFGVYYWASPYNTDVGYMPKQPIAYSHLQHAGELQMDCRYCHAYVERGPHAGVPPTQTCMNCHSQIKKDAPTLEVMRQSWTNGTPIAWKRIHKLPDFAYFDHSAHMGFGTGENRAAIGCETCHGRIDTMAVVKQVQPLSMSWCLECHSDPAPNLRPVEAITRMGWTGDLAWRDKAAKIAVGLHPPGDLGRVRVAAADGTHQTFATTGCTGCHR